MFLLASFLLVGLFQIFFPFYPFRFAGFVFFPLDAVYFLMILEIGRYALIRPKGMAKLIRENLFLMAFLGMVAVYVIVYTPIYGQSAIGEARKYYFIFLLPLLALISIKRSEDLRRLVLILVIVAVAIALVALTKVGMEGSILRVLNAEATLTLALVAFALLVHQIHKTVIITARVDKALLLLFFVIVLGSGQRSCWLAVGFGLIFMSWLYRRRAILMAKMVMLGLVGLMGLTAALIMFPETSSRLAQKFSGITDPYADKTASWRIRGWEAQLVEVKKNVFFGEGVGNYDGGLFRQGNPHNAYIQMTVKFGLFGVILYSLLVIQFFRQTLHVRGKLRPGPMKAYIETGILTFAAVHVYMLGYGIHPFAMIFFGMGTCAARISRQALQYSQASRMPPLPENIRAPHRRFLPRRTPEYS